MAQHTPLHWAMQRASAAPLTIPSRRVHAALAACALFLVSGCGTTQSSDAVRRFSDTLKAVSSETRTGFAPVEELERRAIREDATLRYVQTGRVDLAPTVVFTGQAAAALEPAFQALDQYAAALAVLSAGGRGERLGAAAARFGRESAQALDRAGFRVPTELMQRGTCALDQLGQLVAEEIVRLSLPAVIGRAHPNIEAIAELATAVVGRPSRGGEVPQGLRGVRDERRRALSVTRRTMLAEMARSATPADRYDFYPSVPKNDGVGTARALRRGPRRASAGDWRDGAGARGFAQPRDGCGCGGVLRERRAPAPGGLETDPPLMR